jgi:hypothetical protein
MALFMLIVGAAAVVAGVAMLSVAAAVICVGTLLMAAAVALAAVQDRKAPVGAVE